MKVSEILAKIAQEKATKKTRNPPTYDEHYLQCAEVEYMRATHPELSRVFFAVPNGQKRSKVQAVWLHAEGLVNGVADMILLKPNRFYSYLCIENKTAKGHQSPEQKAFEQDVLRNGGFYIVVRSLDDFISVINNYLKDVDP